MPINVNFKHMSGHYAANSLQSINKIMEVITIDDDEYDNNNVEYTVDDNDEIEIIEIRPNLESITERKPLDQLKSTDVRTELMSHITVIDETISENGGKSLKDSFDSCLQTINDLKGELIDSKADLNSEAVVDSSDDKQIDPKSPKRISPTSLPTCASTSKVEHQSPDSSSDPTPNKLRRLSISDEIPSSSSVSTDANIPSTSSADPKPSTSSPKLDFETLFQNYLKAFKVRMIALNSNQNQTQELVTKLEEIYIKVKNNNSKFLNGIQFAKLMTIFTEEVTEMSSDIAVIRHHNDLIIELHRFSQKTEQKNVIKVQNRGKKIKALTEAIKKLQKQIYAAENEELDLDSLDRPSSFTDLPKLYRKVNEIWAKREEILKRSTNTGRVMFKKYKYDSTPYSDINKCVEKLFNSHLKKIKKTSKGYADESFTFIDVRKAILEVINEKQLVIMNIESMIENIYKDFVNEKRARRQKDSEEVFETLESLADLKPESFVENDPQMELELAKNKKFFQKRMDELFDKYANEDRKKNGESVLTEGLSEWDTDLTNNNDESESLDVKDGELEDEDNEEDSDDNIDVPSVPSPEFALNQQKQEPVSPIITSAEAIANGDDQSFDDIIILD